MNQDYFIDDQDQYNWVTLPKPLSSYTKEELAEQLIKSQQETGKNQTVRIGGKIGAILSTDGCNTPEDFLNKYHAVLDRAGFNKIEEKKEEVKPLTVKPKALSKVSLMDYTQEELAHLIMDDKINNNDGTEYGIYEHRDTIFDSTGCNTIEDFINKYQEEFRKRRIKAADGTLPKKMEIPVPEEIKPSNITKDGIRVITIPLGMMNYTQEDLAHLAMDNKQENEEVGIKVENGVVLDTKGCNTVEDFINKHEKVATGLGIKHNYNEKLAAVGNITDMPSNLNSFKFDETKIEAAKTVETIPEPVKEEVIEEPETILSTTTPLIPLLLDMITNKQANNKDVKADYKGNIISTENCNSMTELVNKYQDLINKDHKAEINNLLKNREVEKAVVLFNIPRGNYYNGTEEQEQTKLSAIRDKNNAYAKIIEDAKQVDFSNQKTAYNWLNTVVPYINTHALNLNLGLNVSLDSADKYLLEFMESKGYNTDLTNPNNYETYEKYQITKKLNELKEYRFFISDYPNLAKEDLNLNSSKTNAMAEISYLDAKVARGTKGLGLIAEDLAHVKVKAKAELARLENNIKSVDERLAVKGDSTFKEQAKTEDEIIANKAYMLASVTFAVSDIEKAVSAINELPESSLIKAGLMEATYNLFNHKDAGKNANDPDMVARNGLFDQVDALNKEKDDIILRLNKKQSEIIEAMTFVNAKISKLRVENNLMDYLKEKEPAKANTSAKVEEANKEEVVELNIETPNEETADKIEENIETNEVVPAYEFSLDDEEYDFSLPDANNSIREFVPIKSFKKISKELYDKINLPKVKEVIKKAITKLRENKKAALVYAGFAAAIVIAATAGNAHNNGDQAVDTTVAVETSVDNNEETTEVGNKNNVVEEERLATNTNDAEITSVNAEEAEYTISLDEAAKDTLDQVLDGKEDVYTSLEDAASETNSVSPESLYMPSWSNATGGDYYVEKDGTMNKLSQDEAQDYYQNGENLIQSVENDGTVIGYVNIDNSNSEKSM